GVLDVAIGDDAREPVAIHVDVINVAMACPARRRRGAGETQRSNRGSAADGGLLGMAQTADRLGAGDAAGGRDADEVWAHARATDRVATHEDHVLAAGPAILTG